MSRSPAWALVACDVFKDEIESMDLGQASPVASEFLEMGLHDQPARLREAIQEAIERLETEYPIIEYIILAYGLCGGGLSEVRANRAPLVAPRAHDCIAIMLGGMAAFNQASREHPRAYFYSPGWIRGRRVPGPDRDAYLRALYAARHPGDEEMVEDLIEADRDTYAHCDCAAYVDLAGNRKAEEYCRDCAKALGWRYRKLKGDPALLRGLFAGDWDASRYRVVPPGHQIALRDDDRVITAEPVCEAPSR